MEPAPDPTAYLPGTWALTRSVHDAQLGAGRFDGLATFTLDGEAIEWREHGRLRLASYDGPARRALRILRTADGWEVRFADGRPFHPLELGREAAVEHPCGADRYTGVYSVEGPDAFTVRWRVRGPAKEQQVVSRYVRA